jgi:hypothetical protein
MVLAAANIAPKVSSTAVLVLEVDQFGDGGQLEPGVVLDRVLELTVFIGTGGADLHARDRAVAAGIPLDVLQVCPDLAFRGAATRAEDAHDPVLLLFPEFEFATDLGILEPLGHTPADEALAAAFNQVLPLHDPEVGPQFPRNRLHAANDDVGPGPILAFGDRDVQQFLRGQRAALLIASDPGQVEQLIGLRCLEAACRLVRRALSHHDDVERIAGDSQAMFQSIHEPEKDARRPDDQPRTEHGHQRRLPSDPEIANVIFDGNHDVVR